MASNINNTLTKLVNDFANSDITSWLHPYNVNAHERNVKLLNCDGPIIIQNDKYTVHDINYVHGGRKLVVAKIHIGNECHIIQPYYCSSGHNSGEPGKWFPFNGFHIALSEIYANVSKEHVYFITNWIRKFTVDLRGNEQEQVSEYDRFMGSKIHVDISDALFDYHACLVCETPRN